MKDAKPWCVMHRDGWCVMKSQPQKQEPRYRDNVRTLCAHYVVLPGAFKRRKPTCKECLSK